MPYALGQHEIRAQPCVNAHGHGWDDRSGPSLRSLLSCGWDQIGEVIGSLVSACSRAVLDFFSGNQFLSKSAEKKKSKHVRLHLLFYPDWPPLEPSLYRPAAWETERTDCPIPSSLGWQPANWTILYKGGTSSWHSISSLMWLRVKPLWIHFQCVSFAYGVYGTKQY